MQNLFVLATLVLAGNLTAAGHATKQKGKPSPKKKVISYTEYVRPDRRWKASDHSVTIDLSRDGLTFLTMDEVNGDLSSWHISEGSKEVTHLAHSIRKGHGFAVMSSDGKIAASDGKDTSVDLWDVATLASLGKIDAGSPDGELAFVPGTHTLLYQTKTGFASYDCNARKTLSSVKLHLEGNILLRTSDDGEICAVVDVDSDSGVYLWHWKNGNKFEHVTFSKQITQFPPTTRGQFFVQTIEFKRHGKYATLTTQLYALNLSTHQKKTMLDFALDDRFLAFEFYNPELSVAVLHPRIDLLVNKDRKITKYLSATDGNSLLCRLTPDGHTLVAAGDDGIVRVWNLIPRAPQAL